MAELNNTRIAIIAMDGFEESELTGPMEALRAAGAKVDVVSEKIGEIQGYTHHEKSGTVKVDRTFRELRPENYDGILLPGGALNADQTRMVPDVQSMIREMDQAGKPIAAICHAPWELISAGILRGRKLTSWKTIQDDIRNAGGEWSDREVVVDGNLVTSRGPMDLPAFNREIIRLFSRVPVETGR
jgi:protease I